ncbi:MAG: Type secretory pathway component PulK-like protein [Schlesneria sp.]|nr:Type secretory pathway component PulK-like protein [Schlesneria sp.]
MKLQAKLNLSANTRRGSVLLIVLVIVALLTLAAYNYTQMMMTENEATTMYGSDIQAREAADSGIEYVATILGNRTDPALENLQHNPALFMGKTVVPSPRARGTARFSVIAPVEQATHSNAIRYGLMDESAKLNLNLLLTMKLEDDEIHTLLLNIPGMTIEAADCILDWIDTDDTKRPYGAESEIYEAMSPPYRAKNGPLESLDELLMVQGVTPALLYGEDANRNGLLDPNENDGDASPPLDNHNGVLDHGWVSFLTAYGRESNLRADGRPKIHLNNGLLTDLYDELEDEFGETTAKFIIAIRLNGPKTTAPASTSSKSGSSSSTSGSSGSSSKSSGSSGSSSGSKTGSSGSSSTGGKSGSSGSSASSGGKSTSGSSSQAGQQQQQQQAIQGLTKAIASAALSPGGKVTRGNIDISAGGSYNITSMWVLFGATANALVGGTSTDIPSPWPAEPNQLKAALPKLMDTLSTSNDEYLDGRININQARREILLGIPVLTEELVDKIILAQKLDSNGQPSPDVIQQHNTTGWLFFEGLVDIPTMVTLDPYFTARGDVYRAQIFGFYDGGGPITRLEAMVDGTQKPPRIIFQRDLNDLGHGYSRMQIFPVIR